MKSVLPVAGAFAAFASVAIGLALTLAQDAYSQSNAAAAEMTRPDDVERWVTVGVTVRLDRQDRATPWQMRQVSMAPDAYAHFVSTREFADGTAFAATFYALTLDTSHTPPLYHAADEEAFAMEVIDRAHPDGRRFYVFASGETRAAPLPAGNECAVCHNARGDFDGTFSDAYPAIRARLGARRTYAAAARVLIYAAPVGRTAASAHLFELARTSLRKRARKGAFEESPGSTRIRRRVTPAESDLRDSATENSLPKAPWSPNESLEALGAGDGETVE